MKHLKASGDIDHGGEWENNNLRSGQTEIQEAKLKAWSTIAESRLNQSHDGE